MAKSLLIIPIISENPELFEHLLISNNTFQRFKIVFSISTSNNYVEIYKTLCNKDTCECVVFDETDKSKLFYKTINFFEKQKKINSYKYIISTSDYNCTNIAVFYNILEKIEETYLPLIYPKTYNKLKITNRELFSKSFTNTFIVRKDFLKFLGSNPYNRLKTYLNIILKSNCYKRRLLTLSN
ncbi:hypothetical protein [uncultured Polaribacter sp.]|uniref:hypothetical protein n=1 Tax=uncultured Polaribacter sp. TaxID=174711 RepID=UPI00259BDB75|nr:hypothetical protein [uncultured Polaribacter sp.]